MIDCRNFCRDLLCTIIEVLCIIMKNTNLFMSIVQCFELLQQQNLQQVIIVILKLCVCVCVGGRQPSVSFLRRWLLFLLFFEMVFQGWPVSPGDDCVSLVLGLQVCVTMPSLLRGHGAGAQALMLWSELPFQRSRPFGWIGYWLCHRTWH